ncbi:unnamed protein product, partial [Thlaspi arvense]
MSSKEKPTLGGTRIKNRKRNITTPFDPTAFSDAVVVIYLDNAGDLDLVAKNIESSDLNFSRYGDIFFEVVFIGGRTQTGSVKSDEGERHPYSIIDCEPKRESILPSVVYIQKILRRKPFLIKNLENVTRRFLQSLELFEENERKKLAIFTSLAFSQKLSGLPAETVFQPLLKDNLVAKGIVLTFVTDFFNEYLVENSLDDLIAILRRGKMEDKLLDFLPPTKRTTESFAEHFNNAGLTALVEYNDKKIFEVKLKEIKAVLTSQVTEEIDVDEVIEAVKQQVKDAKLPEIEVVRVIWDGIMDAVQWSGKNQQQNSNSVLRQVKTWAPLLNTFCSNGKMEMELMYKVQMQCYEDAKLMKVFPEVVRSLYELDVLAEDTILRWYHKGSNTKGRQTFVKGLEPFVNWLEEAEEEEGLLFFTPMTTSSFLLSASPPSAALLGRFLRRSWSSSKIHYRLSRVLNSSSRTEVSIDTSEADKLVDKIDFGELCNEFECTSSPQDTIRSFTGREKYKRPMWITKELENPTVTIQEMVMLSTSVLRIRWTVKGKPKSFLAALSGDLIIKVKSEFTLNQISGQVIEHEESWDSSSSSPIAQAYFWTSRRIFAASESAKDLVDTTKDITASFNTRKEDTEIYRDPSDPTKYFQRDDSLERDVYQIALFLAIVYFVVQFLKNTL